MNKVGFLNTIIMIMIPLYLCTVVLSCSKPLVLEDRSTPKDDPGSPKGGGGGTPVTSEKIFLIKDIYSSEDISTKKVSMNTEADIYSVDVTGLKTNDKVLVMGNYNASTSEVLVGGVLESYIRKDEEELFTKNLSLFHKKLENTNINLVSLDTITKDTANKKYSIHLKLTTTLDPNAVVDNGTISILDDGGKISAFVYSEYDLDDLLNGKYNDHHPYYLASYEHTVPTEDLTSYDLSANEYKTFQNIDNISLKKGDYVHIVGQSSIDMLYDVSNPQSPKYCIKNPSINGNVSSLKYDIVNNITNTSTQETNMISNIKRNYAFTNSDVVSFSDLYKVEEDGVFSLSSGVKLGAGVSCPNVTMRKVYSSFSVYVFRNVPLSGNEITFYYLKAIDSKESSDIFKEHDYKELSVHSTDKKENEEALFSFNIKEFSREDILDIKSDFFVYQLEDTKHYQLLSRYETKCSSGTKSVSSPYTAAFFRDISAFNNNSHNKMNFSNYYSGKLDQASLKSDSECDSTIKFLGYSESDIGTSTFSLYGLDSVMQHWKHISLIEEDAGEL